MVCYLKHKTCAEQFLEMPDCDVLFTTVSQKPDSIPLALRGY